MLTKGLQVWQQLTFRVSTRPCTACVADVPSGRPLTRRVQDATGAHRMRCPSTSFSRSKIQPATTTHARTAKGLNVHYVHKRALCTCRLGSRPVDHDEMQLRLGVPGDTALACPLRTHSVAIQFTKVIDRMYTIYLTPATEPQRKTQNVGSSPPQLTDGTAAAARRSLSCRQ